MEARIRAGAPNLPGMPQLPGQCIGAAAGLSLTGGETKIEQLGKSLIEGLEVEGMRYIFALAGPVLSWEVCTSTKLQLPVMTRTIGSFGERTCICKCTPV